MNNWNGTPPHWKDTHLRPDPYFTENDRWPSGGDGPVSWLKSLGQGWQWDNLSAEIAQESQARLAVVGLPGAGKRFLLNRLLGWQVVQHRVEPNGHLHLEPYGPFLIVHLPERQAVPVDGGHLLPQLGAPDLILYLLDGPQGVRPLDYRWISALRAAGKPLVVALNKCDLLEEPPLAELTRKVGMPIIPISAHYGDNVETRLLPALLQANPQLTIPLAREIVGLRRSAARRVIRQGALFAAMVSAQPLPFLDVPMQALLQSGVVMRVGAIYGFAPGGGLNREIVSAVATTLGARYLAQTAIKFVPVVGSVVSSGMAAAATLALGEAAIRYYEAGATVPLPHWLSTTQLELRERAWPRPRLPRWLHRKEGDEDVTE